MARIEVINGVLNINKPAGITSHGVVAGIRGVIREYAKQVGLPTEARRAKVGHCGTLDPFATGVLLVALGSATRLCRYTLSLPKTYRASVMLGAYSTTDDLTGELTPGSADKRASREMILAALTHFTGTIKQLPPWYSAVKVRGKKLYEYARRGLPTDASPPAGESPRRPMRRVTIYAITVQNYSYPALELEVVCSSGTYIRALARDIGEYLGCGGYLSRLHRQSIGGFKTSQSVNLTELTPAALTTALQTPDALVAHLPTLSLPATNVAQLQQGRAVPLPEPLPPDQPTALFDQENILIGIGHYDVGTTLLHPDKIL